MEEPEHAHINLAKVNADQWWFREDNSRVRIIGFMTDGRVCYESWGFALTCEESEFDKMRHEPDCTGFQWKCPTKPTQE